MSHRQLITSSPSLLETAVILAKSWPAHPLSRRILSALYEARVSGPITTSPMFFVGSGLVVAGGLGRVACYRALGRNFTFQLAILKDHSLVTCGPDYNVQREPGLMDERI
ncbi:uncharacterized protein FIBRA_04237 [Fibroporia radiculosa]|uniref:Uncharacterized protein n=1 Tax=Fibroporia radiculosa TaxID=599839 RepID=J4H2V0_9APHY|nr:uncharacterized protein FIBRA_04237 [Fibroporia radiculosa]CCM02159.1 predicted protein [Fibroporia radiculosa]